MRAEEAEIKSAYKRLAMQYHPDRNNGSKFHEEHFKKIVEAYQVLSHKESRDNYDLKLFYSSLNTYASRSATPPRQPAPSNPDPAARPPGGPYGAGSYGHRPAGGPGKPRYGGDGKPHYGGEGRPGYAARQKNYRPAPRTKSRFNLHTVSLGLLFAASMILLAAWADQIARRHKAEQLCAGGEYTFALLEDSTCAEAWLGRAKYRLMETGNTEAALSDLDHAVLHAEEPMPYAYKLRGIAHLNQQKWEEAVSDFEAQSLLEPNNDTALYYAADLRLYRLNDTKAALLLFDKVLAINKNYYSAWFGKGYAELKLERYSESKRSFTAALSINDSRSDLHYYRAYAGLGLADTLSACADWDQALTMGFEQAKIPYDEICRNIKLKPRY